MSKLSEETKFGPESPLRYFVLLFPFAIATNTVAKAIPVYERLVLLNK